MNLDFKTLEEFLQDYINNDMSEDLGKVSPAQRLGFIEKYLEFIKGKQLRRGAEDVSGDESIDIDYSKLLEFYEKHSTNSGIPTGDSDSAQV